MSSVQKLSAFRTRRLSRKLGNPTITRAWVDNAVDHHVIRWVTWDHIHGWYHRQTGMSSYEIYASPWNAVVAHASHTPECYDEQGSLLLELEPFEDDGRWPVQGYDR